MAHAHAQSVVARLTTSGTAITTGAVTTSNGSLLVASAVTDDTTKTITVSDSKTNAWLLRKGQNTPVGTARVEQWSTHNITGGSGHTFTNTLSSAGFPCIAVSEFTGADIVYPFDQTTSTTDTASPYPTPPTLETALPNEVLVGSFTFDGSTTPTITASGGYSEGAEIEDGVNGMPVSQIYRIVSQVGRYTADWTSSAALNAAIIVGTYRAAATFVAGASTGPGIVIGSSTSFVGEGTIGAPDTTSGAFTLTAAAGSYSISGQAATLLKSRILTAAAGSYTISGQAASLKVGYKLTADAGSYSISGQAATILHNSVLTAVAGSYAISGQAAALLKSRIVVADAGAYAISGQAASIVYTPAAGAFTLAANAGSYAISGQDAAFVYTAAAATHGILPGDSYWFDWWRRQHKRPVEEETPARERTQKAQFVPPAATKPAPPKLLPETIRALERAVSIEDVRALASELKAFERAAVEQLVAEAEREQDEDDVEVLVLALL